jgi:hypothetical protein
MKRILLILSLFFSFVCSAQNPIGLFWQLNTTTGGGGTTTYFFDTFTGADNTNNLGAHTPDVSANTYNINGQTFGINSNRAYVTPAASGAGWIFNANTNGSANGTFQVDITTGTTQGRTDMSLTFRGTASTSNLQLVLADAAGGSSMSLYKVITGSYTQLATTTLSLLTPGTTHTISAVCNGTLIQCYLDGVLKITYNTSTPYDAAKGIGLAYFVGGSNDNGTGFWDNLKETN